MLEPLVSVVIPCYNHEKFVQDCIQSVINQSYGNIELIIIDDGSKDCSKEKVESMLNKCEDRFSRFKFYSRPNKGLSATLNEALEWCKGDYFSIIASDDQMLPHKIEYQVNYLQSNSKVVACFGNVKLIDDNNKVIKVENHPKRTYDFNEIFLNKHHINASTQMIRMNVIHNVGGYKNGITIEDLYMWLKLAAVGQLYSDKEVLSLYRLHGDNSIKKIDFIYKGCLDVLAEYNTHILYLNAVKKLFWVYASNIAVINKRESLAYLFNVLKCSPQDIFSKNFLRFMRNFLLR